VDACCHDGVTAVLALHDAPEVRPGFWTVSSAAWLVLLSRFAAAGTCCHIGAACSAQMMQQAAKAATCATPSRGTPLQHARTGRVSAPCSNAMYRGMTRDHCVEFQPGQRRRQPVAVERKVKLLMFCTSGSASAASYMFIPY
jgi:hypothetical protein